MTQDQALREHLVYLLDGGGAHGSFNDVIKDFPQALRGKIPKNLEHSAWQVVEHTRYCQEDILEYMVASEYRERSFPDDYWVEDPQPPSSEAWDLCIEAFNKDLKTIKDLVKNTTTNLFASVPHGPHTVLREVLLIADHNAYHIGQLVYIRELSGIPYSGF